jgi:acyl-CoA thioesterase
VETREDHANPHGVMHGGVLFSLADTSMGAALYTLLEADETCTTIEVKMNFLRPVTQGRLACETHVLRRGRSTAVLESRLLSGESLVAVALGTYAILPKPPVEA